MKLAVFSLAVLISAISVNSQCAGCGGVVGRLTPRTGGSWPPYPGAGYGYWARRSGYYNRVKRSPQFSSPYAGYGRFITGFRRASSNGYNRFNNNNRGASTRRSGGDYGVVFGNGYRPATYRVTHSEGRK